MLTIKDVEMLSQSLDEPEWLLEERIYAFSLFQEFAAKDKTNAEKLEKFYSQSNNRIIRRIKTASATGGFGALSLHDLLHNRLKADFAKETFLNKEHKPEDSIENAFLLAFFDSCNFYFAEAGGECDFKSESDSGISIDFFFIDDKCTGKISRKITKAMRLEEFNFSADCKIESMIINEVAGYSYLSCVNIVGEKSRIDTYSGAFGSGVIKTVNKLIGEGAEAYDVELFVEGAKNDLRVSSTLTHAGQNTKGNIHVRGIGRDESNVKLDGMIRIGVNGCGAESFLEQHVMLMNPGCRAEANPELEIENNDVSSRHSASVSQIDEEKIFYTMAKGMGEDEAKNMIVDGFLNSAVSRIKNDKFREEMLELVGKYQN